MIEWKEWKQLPLRKSSTTITSTQFGIRQYDLYGQLRSRALHLLLNKDKPAMSAKIDITILTPGEFLLVKMAIKKNGLPSHAR